MPSRLTVRSRAASTKGSTQLLDPSAEQYQYLSSLTNSTPLINYVLGRLACAFEACALHCSCASCAKQLEALSSHMWARPCAAIVGAQPHKQRGLEASETTNAGPQTTRNACCCCRPGTRDASRQLHKVCKLVDMRSLLASILSHPVRRCWPGWSDCIASRCSSTISYKENYHAAQQPELARSSPSEHKFRQSVLKNLVVGMSPGALPTDLGKGGGQAQ